MRAFCAHAASDEPGLSAMRSEVEGTARRVALKEEGVVRVACGVLLRLEERIEVPE